MFQNKSPPMMRMFVFIDRAFIVKHYNKVTHVQQSVQFYTKIKNKNVSILH